MRRHDDLPMKNPQIISDIQKCLEAMNIAANNYSLGQNLDGTKRIRATETEDVHLIPVGDGKKRVEAFIAEVGKLLQSLLSVELGVNKTKEDVPLVLLALQIKTIALLDSLLDSSSTILKKMVCDKLLASSGMYLNDHVVHEVIRILDYGEYGRPRVEETAPDSIKTLKAAVDCYRQSLPSAQANVFAHAKNDYNPLINPSGMFQALRASFSKLFNQNTGAGANPNPSDDKRETPKR